MSHAKITFSKLMSAGLVILFFLSGCKSLRVGALENAASVIQIKTGHEIRRFTTNEGSALGKPVYATVFIVYEPIGNYATKDVYREIVTILKQNKWEGVEPLKDRDYFKATLQQDGFEISASVATDEEKNIVTVKLIIY
jgi:hypothetical protein